MVLDMPSDFQQYYLPTDDQLAQNNITQLGGNSIVTSGSLQSQNYAQGRSGYKLTNDGEVELNLESGKLTIGGFAVVGNLSNILGDGSDGAYVLNASQAAVTGLFSKSGSTFTLLRDGFFTDLTIASGYILKQNGYVIYCTGTLRDDGTRHVNGGDGGAGSGSTAGTAGARAHSDGTLWGGIAGKAGGTGGTPGPTNGSAGTAGDAASYALLSNGVAGGSGGDANPTAPAGFGGGGGSGGTATATKASPRVLITGFMMRDVAESTLPYLRGGAGSGSGGGGGCQSGNGGGGGGSGATGGTMVFTCKVWAGEGAVEAKGGAGGSGGNAGGGNNNGGGGGGGGGCGGVIRAFYNVKSFSGTISYGGGGGGGGGSGTGAGNSGNSGSNGASGLFIETPI